MHHLPLACIAEHLHVCTCHFTCMRFVKGDLWATASQETSSVLKYCMRAFMHAYGMTSCLRCNLAETAGLDFMEGAEVGQQVDQMWKPGLRWPPGGYSNDLAVVSGSKILTDLIQQGKR